MCIPLFDVLFSSCFCCCCKCVVREARGLAARNVCSNDDMAIGSKHCKVRKKTVECMDYSLGQADSVDSGHRQQDRFCDLVGASFCYLKAHGILGVRGTGGGSGKSGCRGPLTFRMRP